MKNSIRLILLSLFVAAGLQAKPKNILFIAVDDLRPNINYFGESQMITPNIDKLSKSGRPFLNHFVQIPTCGASRYSMLSGLRPRAPEMLKNEYAEKTLHKRKEVQKPESFAHHLRRNGYYTVAIGKVSHTPDGLVNPYLKFDKNAPKEFPYSWDERLCEIGIWQTPWNAFFAYADGTSGANFKNRVIPFEAGSNDIEYPDTLNASLAIKKLETLKNQDKPFMLAVGFFKPHLPFNSPKKFWDLYDESKIEIANPDVYPKGLSKSFAMNSGELNGYIKPPSKKINNSKKTDVAYQQKLRHAYYAAVSYMDNEVGRVLNALDELGLADDTVVILWGDHGWQLGENGMWGKHDLFKKAIVSPLIVRVPNMKDAGVKSNSVVESVDIFPTICDIAEIEKPQGIDGKSLLPILNNPNAKTKDFAFTHWNGNCISIACDKYHMIVNAYQNGDKAPKVLFNRSTDPLETKNVSKDEADVFESMNLNLKKYVQDFNIDYLNKLPYKKAPVKKSKSKK